MDRVNFFLTAEEFKELPTDTKNPDVRVLLENASFSWKSLEAETHEKTDPDKKILE